MLSYFAYYLHLMGISFFFVEQTQTFELANIFSHLL